jgi:hypothetical protein
MQMSIGRETKAHRKAMLKRGYERKSIAHGSAWHYVKKKKGTSHGSKRK